MLAGKLASKQRRDNCNTTLYFSPKTFDGNNLSDVTTPKQKREEKQTSLSPVLFHLSCHASSPMVPLQKEEGVGGSPCSFWRKEPWLYRLTWALMKSAISSNVCELMRTPVMQEIMRHAMYMYHQHLVFILFFSVT